MERRTVRICRAGDHLSEEEDEEEVQNRTESDSE